MASQQSPESGDFYTRGELELALGRLVLSLERVAGAQQRSRLRVAEPEKRVTEFLAMAAEIFRRTHPQHRPALLQRLGSLTQATGLGLAGLEEWLEAGASPPDVTSDRHVAMNVTWEGAGPSTSSSGRL